MPLLLKKKKSDIEQIKESAKEESKTDLDFKPNEGNFDLTVSTGSTLLDLAISGKKVRGGGVPGGILVEIFGPSGAGKTGVLSELCGSAQLRGGEVRFADPEARLDQAYSQIYGVIVQEDFFDYSRPDTVEEIFSLIETWKPKNPKVLNLFAGDSIAALSTELEMGEGDKMGMKRAKDISAGLRKNCRLIANNNWVIAFTNQIRQGTDGRNVTPGGLGLPFYASLRIQITPQFQGSKIEKEITLESGVKVKQVIGIKSTCTIAKSSIDEPYRTAPISIIFNYGLDDVRSNLQYFKDMTKAAKYNAFTKEFMSMESAIKHIESEGLEKQLREQTIDLWESIQKQFNQNRTSKRRL